jgi:hypothetical protein
VTVVDAELLGVTVADAATLREALTEGEMLGDGETEGPVVAEPYTDVVGVTLGDGETLGVALPLAMLAEALALAVTLPLGEVDVMGDALTLPLPLVLAETDTDCGVLGETLGLGEADAEGAEGETLPLTLPLALDARQLAETNRVAVLVRLLSHGGGVRAALPRDGPRAGTPRCAPCTHVRRNNHTAT